MRFFAWTKQLIKNHYFYLTLIILLSIFFRFWQLSQRISFEADQETVAFMAKQLLIDHKPTLLGVITSSGNIFLGPLYYYLYALPMILTAMNPVSQAFLSSLIGVASTLMFYIVGKKMFSKEVGLLTAFFQATSVLVIGFERAIWNVTGALLIFIPIYYCFYKIGSGNKKYWMYLLMLIGLSLHFHLTAIFFVPTAVLFFFYMFLQTRKLIKDDFKYLLLGLIGFGIILSPLMLFDLRHSFMNSKNILAFFLGDGINPHYLAKVQQVIVDELTILSSIVHLPLLVGVISFAGAMLALKKVQNNLVVVYILLFLVVSFGFALFQGQVTSYYYLLLFPMVILGFSNLLVGLVRFKKILLAPLLLYLGFLVVANTQTFLEQRTSFALPSKQKVVNYIVKQAGGKPYYVSTSIDKSRNFGFKYLFWLTGHEPSSTLINPVYTIVIPFDYGGIKPDFKIDDIGLVMPKKD